MSWLLFPPSNHPCTWGFVSFGGSLKLQQENEFLSWNIFIAFEKWLGLT